MNPTPGIRPDWVDDTLLPYDSHFAEVEDCTVHYLDEGEGPTLLMLHGNPTWSFLYRDMIADLRADFRCVAPDYPGMGLSSARGGYAFGPEEHSRIVAELVQELNLTDITLVMQDWGGPIGMAAAAEDPDRYSSGWQPRATSIQIRERRGWSPGRLATEPCVPLWRGATICWGR
ncbi:MAG: alpha/beta fold hydrolase, partial [Euzebya sp.]